MKTKCDNCENAFEIKILTNEVLVPEQAMEVYFRCPHCFEKYRCYFLNDESMNLQAEINYIHKRLITEKMNEKQRTKLLKNLKGLRIKKRNVLTGLKKRMNKVLN